MDVYVREMEMAKILNFFSVKIQYLLKIYWMLAVDRVRDKRQLQRIPSTVTFVYP